MTSEKIKTILTDIYGISNPLNHWTKLNQISIIFLSQDANIYLNEDEIYYFNTEDNSLCISKSSKFKNIQEADLKKPLDSYPILGKVSFDFIAGFIQTVRCGYGGVYNRIPF